MPAFWSKKRERQYEHIKDSAKKGGSSTRRAKEIAARTVNKERAQKGEARQASRSSVRDTRPSRRGGRRARTNPPQGRTKEQHNNQAQKLKVPGRAQMSKQQLQRAVDARK